MPHSYKNNKYWELCCLPRRQSWCQAAPGRLPGRRWTCLQKQSFLDLASENGEKKASVGEGGFHTGCTWKAGRRKGRLNAALISQLGWATGANSMTLAKMRGITLIFNSNYASLSSLTEEFWFFNGILDIPQILQKFVIFHLEVLQCFLKLLLIYSILLLLSSLPTDQLDYILCDKCELRVLGTLVCSPKGQHNRDLGLRGQWMKYVVIFTGLSGFYSSDIVFFVFGY